MALRAPLVSFYSYTLPDSLGVVYFFRVVFLAVLRGRETTETALCIRHFSNILVFLFGCYPRGCFGTQPAPGLSLAYGRFISLCLTFPLSLPYQTLLPLSTFRVDRLLPRRVACSHSFPLGFALISICLLSQFPLVVYFLGGALGISYSFRVSRFIYSARVAIGCLLVLALQSLLRPASRNRGVVLRLGLRAVLEPLLAAGPAKVLAQTRPLPTTLRSSCHRFSPWFLLLFYLTRVSFGCLLFLLRSRSYRCRNRR